MTDPITVTIANDPDRARRELDPRYFIESFVRIFDKQSQLVPFVFNEVQAALYESMTQSWQSHRPVRMLVLKARRFGVSYLALGLCLHSAIYTPGSRAVIEAHDLDTANYLFGALLMMYDLLDKNAVPELPATKHREEGLLEFRFPHGGAIVVQTARKLTSGRATQLKFFLGSEVAYWPDASSVMLGVNNALSDNDPNSVAVLESTANGAAGWFYEKYREAKLGLAGEYRAVFFPWWVSSEYQMDPWLVDRNRHPSGFGEADMTDQEAEIMSAHTLTIRQMAWYRWALYNKCENSEERRAQEYPSNDQEAWLATGSCRFKSKTLVAMPVSDSCVRMSFSPEPLRTNDGRVWVWERPAPKSAYVMGADVSEGVLGGDESAIVVLNAQTGMQAAEFHGLLEPEKFGALVASVARWYNWAFVGIEINGPGRSALDAAVRAGLPQNRLWRHSDLDRTSGISSVPGWRTTEISRELAINRLAAAMDDDEVAVRSDDLISQLKAFVRHADGKYRAAGNAHDDLVMALAIGVYLLSDPRSRVLIRAAPIGRPDEDEDDRRKLRWLRPVWSSFGERKLWG